MAGFWDIAEVVLPIAASVVGTPLAGAAVSAAMSAGKTKAKGGSWGNALTQGAISGGLGMLGGAAAGKATGEVAKKIGEGAVKEAGAKALAGETVSRFSAGLTDTAKTNALQGLGGGIDAALTKTTDEGLKKVAASTVENVGKDAGETAAKVRFSEAQTEFLNKAGATAEELDQEAKARRMKTEQENARFLEQMKAGSVPVDQDPYQSQFYKPYQGSY